MALTDVVFTSGNSAAAARGDGGTVIDTTAHVGRLFIALPAAASVENGVVFGHQGDEFTGSFVGGGGGGNTYPRGRIVNA
jgi:hypothetical protein